MIKIFILLYIAYKLLNDMSLIKDLDELPVEVKSTTMSIFIFMPIWGCMLYYYFPNIINFDWYKIAMFTFTPSIVWYLVQLATTFSVSIYFKKILGIDSIEDRIFYRIVFIDGFIYLFLLSIIGYYMHLPFEKFLWFLFGIKVSTLVLISTITISFSNRA